MQIVVKFALIKKLRVFSIGWLELDSDFKVGFGIDSLINFSESSLPYLFDDFEVLSYFLRQAIHICLTRNYYKLSIFTQFYSLIIFLTNSHPE